MAKITITSKKLLSQLKKLTDSLSDATPAFRDIADLELSQTLLRYRSEVDPDGNEWEDPHTIRRGQGPETGSGKRTKTSGWTREEAMEYFKDSNFHAAPPGYRFFDKSIGDKVLRDTGTMMLSIGRAYGKDFALVGTNLEYAQKHQDGDGVKKREFLGINDKTEENVLRVIKSYLLGAVK